MIRDGPRPSSSVPYVDDATWTPDPAFWAAPFRPTIGPRSNTQAGRFGRFPTKAQDGRGSCYLDGQDHRGTPSYRGRTGPEASDLYVNDIRDATAQRPQESATVLEASVQTQGNMPLMPT